MQLSPIFGFYLTFIMLGLLMATSNCYNLSCNGRSVYSKITVKADTKYTPQFYITFGIRLQQNQTLTENLTISLKADNECIPNQLQLNFNFYESECKPFLNWITCGKKFYLNCTKEYREKDKQISFTAQGTVSYINQSLTCKDSGQTIVWEKDASPVTQDDDLGLIIGISVGAAVLVGLAVFLIWKFRKGKKDNQLLNQEE